MPKITQRLRDLFGHTTIHVSITPEENPYVDGMSARQLYATQVNLHTVVSFLADSIAQLPLKVYRIRGEADRQRDRESPAAKLLYRPNADQTAYEFWEAVVKEYLLMGVSTVWLLPDSGSESSFQLRLIPNEWVMDTERRTNYAPDRIRIAAGTGGYIEIPKTEFLQFRMYSPGNPGGFQSPIASLRQTLQEQIQADRFRTEIWSSSGRFNAYITRPKDVAPWNDEQRKAFLAAFREGWARGGSNAGKMPLLEDGMEIKPYQFNAKEAQYAETKQLSREDVAAAYHVNPSLIWHTSTQTYASAKDNARALYADCLGPTLQKIQQRINAFLLPMIGASPDTYVEFDLTEKLKGSFEERAEILQKAVGGPWMTRDEARADNNMAPLPDGQGSQIITPLNVAEGGQASPADTHMDQNNILPPHKLIIPSHRKDSVSIRIKGRAEEKEEEELTQALRKFFQRQAASVLPKIGAGAEWWDEDRWIRELADDLEPLIDKVADKHGMSAAEVLGTEYGTEITRNYLRKLTEGRSRAINASTLQKLKDAIEEEQDPADVFEKRESHDAGTFGQSLATAVSGWAVMEAAQQARREGFSRKIEKEWVTGPNSRPSHAAMNGQRVLIDAKFSNGADWPGDDSLSPDESCGCNCSTDVIITEV